MEAKACIRAIADIQQIKRCKESLNAKQDEIFTISAVLGLAGNEVRFKILYLLYVENELCVCDLSDILQMNISAVSQHLRKLKDGGLINVRKDGQTYFYYLTRSKLPILENLFNMVNSKTLTLKPEIV